ncbi:unnamed protein product [Zymoseptoria tritici ST99CH_1A5]|uniref:Pyrroloquinoline quinone-dependent pyranose dehydrogenase beta-propeller domain-containing protein n=3 Tax=Zymoseptoria tritici TaxID=1047171 RepID=A0A1X7RGJ7_ZYMT9|nr:unnamed protein product [Zymoseptoria tritici ST99CH_3D7]SMR42876.1 unnamed protein product [Zymoseptoria tritici ST99CH_1E4]SMR45046.1 unnamed protein product [Zymoseptoria tritici ST99CH_3D1]SMY20211.1 unnamed protein product [Zymoseptoria tritici ST99CH_1A5]
MQPALVKSLLITSFLWQSLVSAQQTCEGALTPSYVAPAVADGYTARLIADSLTEPRSIKFDSQGALLVVQQNVGISVHTLVDGENDCLSIGSSKWLVNNTLLNHGIELSEDDTTLYASTQTALYSWDYDAEMQTVSSVNRTLVTGMTGTNHQTRTLLLPKSAPNLILISRGSKGNLDYETVNVDSGVSQIKAFDMTNMTEPYDYVQDGLVVGWGLRNSVGVAEHPVDYGIWSVENSADELERSGETVSRDNPAEEMNFHGFLNGTESPDFGQNFGYPTCFAAGAPSALPDFDGQVGDSFVIGSLNDTNSDDSCTNQKPRLSFQAHSAPLDIKFNNAGTAAWMTFHGSWNRDDPTGYSLVVVEFANGQPVESSTSTTAARSVVFTEDLSPCNGGDGTCIRPVGLAWDSKGRLFMTSDGTGELWVITRTDGSPTSGAGSNATGTIPESSGTETSSAAESSDTSTASLMSVGALPLAFVFSVLAFVL